MRITVPQSGGENLRRASAEPVAPERSGVSRLDHGTARPEAVAQRRLETLANQSAQARSTARYQSMLDGAPSVAALRTTQRKIEPAWQVVQRALATVEGLHAAAGSPEKRKAFKSEPGKGFGVKHTFEKSEVPLQTDVTWGSAVKDADGDADGTEMTARPLGPDHKLGSEPGKGESAAWTMRRKKLATAAGKRYIAGHLLNENLGGPGNDERNLAAIPDAINDAHKRQIENPVKKAVNDRGEWGYYHVKITHADDAGTQKKPKKPKKTPQAPPKLKYASNLKATWYPYTLVKDPSTRKVTYQPARGDKIEVSLDIPAPSAYAGSKATKPLISKPTITQVTKGQPVLATPVKYDELTLTGDAFYVASLKLDNVRLIKELEAKNEDATAEKEELEGKMAEYRKEVLALEAERDQLREELEEKEEEVEEAKQILEQRQKEADNKLATALNDQAKKLKARLEKARSTGLNLVVLGFGLEVAGLLGKEGALTSLGVSPEKTEQWLEVQRKKYPREKKTEDKKPQEKKKRKLEERVESDERTKKAKYRYLKANIKTIMGLHIKFGRNLRMPKWASAAEVHEFKELYTLVDKGQLCFDDYGPDDRDLLTSWAKAPALNLSQL